MGAKEARKALSKAVRGAWNTNPDLINLQLELSKKGYELLRKGYRDCLLGRHEKSSASLKDCYQAVAESAGLSNAYRQLWGSPSGGS